ncbi:MAG: hypothetical protein FJY86_02955 [Candidatus Diapherotrites archaeon]|uniref:Uncharacterized protein n=1 Tax=Candidatus Iainarchaeum sp. TaxID=3101447 RepID=A0A8T4C711_9ARCH|nr:hypothetical protein [Candidatus Diapherotrites archaeon]
MALQFSEKQKKLSSALVNGPLSLDQLAERTNLKMSDAQEELKFLMQLKLVSLQGMPPVYALKDEVANELKHRKMIELTDDNTFRVEIMIEVQGVEEELVKRQSEKILENLAKEPFFKIYSKKVAPIEKVDEKYSTYIDVNLSVRDFRGMVRLMFFYGPASIEVIKPSKIEFTLNDFQDGLVDMTDMVHAYANYIMGILNRKQIEEFNAKLFRGVGNAQHVKASQGKPETKENPSVDDLPTI